MPPDHTAILDFWFSPRVRPLWFDAGADFDEEVRVRFLPLYQQALRGDLSAWEDDAMSSLALVIVLDQFPLNMFRGRPESFAGEQEAGRVARQAVERGYDVQLSAKQKAFLYMPLMHSEDLADQDLALELFARAGLEDNLGWARHHRELIRRFGRFPHRNAILGRPSTAEEMAYLASPEAFHG